MSRQSAPTEREPLLRAVRDAPRDPNYSWIDPRGAVGVAEGVEVGGTENVPKTKTYRGGVRSMTHRWLVLAGLWLSNLTVSATTGGTATLVPVIASELNAGHLASWIGTSYLLATTAFAPIWGSLTAIYGRRSAMLTCILVFVVGTLGCGASQTMGQFLAARAIAGAGGAGILTVVSVITTDLVPLRSRALYQGVMLIVFGIGTGAGAPLAGLLSDRLSNGWRVSFYAQVPVLILSALMTYLNLPTLPNANTSAFSTREQLVRVDFLGAASLTVSLGASMLGLNLGISKGWGATPVVALFVAGVVAAVVFVVAEVWVAAEPILPMRLVFQRTPGFVLLCCFFISIANAAMQYNIPLYFTLSRLESSAAAGLHLLPNAIGSAVGALLAGFVMRHTGRYWMLVILSTLLIVVSSVLMATWSDRTPQWRYWFDVLPLGIAYNASLTSTLIALISSVNYKDVPVLVAASYASRMVASTLGVATLSGMVLQHFVSTELHGRITGPDSDKIIASITANAKAVIPSLPPSLRYAATTSYGQALRTTFGVTAALAFLAVLCSLPIQEFSLADDRGTAKGTVAERQEDEGEQ